MHVLSTVKRVSSYIVFGTFCFYSSSYAATTQTDTNQTSRLRVTNQCQETIWIQQDWQRYTDDGIVVKIEPGLSYDYNIPEKGLPSTRFWPKKGCDENGYQCAVGESTAVPSAVKKGWQKGPFAPDINSKFEATWGCVDAIFNNNPGLCAENPSDPGKNIDSQTWWNGSAVDGYTLPYLINVKDHQNSCRDIHNGKIINDPGVNCGKLDPMLCPNSVNLTTGNKFPSVNGYNLSKINLQWKEPNTNKVIGCFSPCAKLTTAQGSEDGTDAGGLMQILGGLEPQAPAAQMYCCPTPPVEPGQCSAGPAHNNEYAQSVSITQQCNSYTYAYDDAKGLARCGSQTKFEIVFCPKKIDIPIADKVEMKLVIPASVTAQFNGKSAVNGQSVTVVTGSEISVVGTRTTSCSLKVGTQKLVVVDSGSLCAKLTVNNNDKAITLPKDEVIPPAETTYKMQFNFNPHVGITTLLNDTSLNNAQKLEASKFPQNSILKAYQGNKSATCNLTIGESNITRGLGEFCNRLNINKDGSGLVHVYLPADIPDMGSGGTKPKYVVFGMSPDMHVNFLHHIATNGYKIALEHLGSAQKIEMIAHQNSISAACTIGHSGDSLSIVQDSGRLCSSGLVLQTQDNGNYYIGLPNTLPQKEQGGGGDTKAYGLGIAAGMSVMVNGKTISWKSLDKTIQLPDGTTTLSIKGNNGLIRSCPVNRSGTNLTWPNNPDCVGVVVHGDILYFPAF